MKKKRENMRDEEIKQSILRLSHFNPNIRDEYGNQVIDYLVLNSLASYGPMFKVKVSEIKDEIKNSFNLDFEIEEIIASGKRLHSNGSIKYIGKFGKEERIEEVPKFTILSEEHQRIESLLAEIRDLE